MKQIIDDTTPPGQDEPLPTDNPEEVNGNINNDKISFSVVTKNSGILTKKLSLKDGKIVKDGSQCRLGLGTIKTYTCTPEQFARDLSKLKKNMALVHGVPEHEEAVICSKKRFDEVRKNTKNKPVITRTKDHLSYPDGPGLMMFDHDKANDNAITIEDKALKSFKPSELIDVLAQCHPELSDAAYVSTSSTSSCIYDKDGNELRGEGDGSHIYLFLMLPSDIPRYLKVSGKRQILAGYGRIEISRSGSLNIRTLVDLSVGSPERLDFVAGAVCEDDLKQRLPAPYHHPGGLLDTTTLIDLTDAEEDRYNQVIQELKDKSKPRQKIIRESYINDEADKLSKSKNIDIDKARAIIRSRQDHILEDTDLLYFAHNKGKSTAVAEVLDDGASYDGMSLADVLEPEYDGGSMTKATFFWNNGKPAIYSHAHGGINYKFKRFTAKNGRKIKFISSSDLVFAPPDWLIKNYLEKKTTSTFFGAPASMKTFIAIDMGLCIASGKDWHGNKVKQGSVLYICGEGQSGIKKRVQAWETYHDIEAPQFFVSTCPAQILSSDSLKAVEKAANDATDGRDKPLFIIVDTLNRNFGSGDENSTSDMTKFIQGIDQLRDRLGCAISTVHHTGVNNSDRGRGSSVLLGAMDFEYKCSTSYFNLSEKAVTLTSTKTKDHESPPPITFKSIIIDLGIVDEDNKPVTSLVLEPTDELPALGATLSKAKGIALDALINVTNNGKGATESLWRDEAYAQGISPTGTPQANKKAFARAKKSLLNDDLIQKQDDLYLPTPSNISDSLQGDRQGQERTCPAVSHSN